MHWTTRIVRVLNQTKARVFRERGKGDVLVNIHRRDQTLAATIFRHEINAVVDGDGPENNSYEIVDIYNDGSLKINGYRRATDRELIK